MSLESDAPRSPDPRVLRRTLRTLEGVAHQLGLHVRYDAIVMPGRQPGESSRTGRGGLCRIEGRSVILCDRGLPVVDKVAVLAEAIARFDVEPLHLPPILRARLRGRAGG